jgi:hypothetical protein
MRTMHALKRVTGMTLVVAMLFISTAGSSGCFRQRFDVGGGATGGESREFRQWYAFWGLLPITDVQDRAERHAEGAANYTVTSEFTPLDFLIGIFTGIVTIYPKTMRVER